MIRHSDTSCPFFMTHHAPLGAWSSLTFGLPGRGAGIESQSNRVTINANLLVAVSRGPGHVRALPFSSSSGELDLEAKNLAGSKDAAGWRYINPALITRRLSPCVDEYDAGDVVLRVYTPHPSPPDPGTQADDADLKYACCPGLLLELEIDNTQYDRPAWGCLGLQWLGIGRLLPMDWTSDGQLAGVGCEGRWALAATRVAGGVYTCRDNSILTHVATGREIVHPGGADGAILLSVPPGERRTLRAAMGFYREGIVTQGLPARQLYADFFENVQDVCRFVLHSAERIVNDCRAFDVAAQAACPDPRRREYFSQAVRAYDANTQLLRDADGKTLYNVCEGQFCWRNTLDLAADHLPWELWRMPWVVRNILQQFVDRYSYRDEVRFAEDPENYYAGGLCFTHDMGTHTVYSPRGRGGYEMPETSGYSFMTSEELLNGVYLLAGYGLATSDKDFTARHLPTARDLLASLLRRDHHDPTRRDGILKGESSKVGSTGREITSYDALDAALKHARGNLYIAVKTFAACLMLSKFFTSAGDGESACQAWGFADRTARTLVNAFDAEKAHLPGNLYEPTDSKVIAAIEPLAIPCFLGLDEQIAHYPDLLLLLTEHVRTCLAGGCVDATTGALRLSSASNNSWPSKGILCLYVLEHLMDIDLDARHPTLLAEMLHWAQVAAAELTISDQINADQRTVRGGSYYPRMVTSALWLRPTLWPRGG